MNFKEELGKVEEKVEQVSFAMELLQFSKEQNVQLEKNNKRMFIIILVLIGVILAVSGAFIYYVNTTGYEETTETTSVENEDGNANACIGDNCNNGEIDYGESNSEKKN